MMSNFPALIDLILKGNYKEIDYSLANEIVNHLNQEPYQISQTQYQILSLYLPFKLLPILQKYSLNQTEESKAKYFLNRLFEMINILELKNNLKF